MTKNTVEVLRALADDTRLGLVRKLAENKRQEASCNLVKKCSLSMSLSQPAMSHHFAKLVDSGVLIEAKHGVQKFYSLNYELLKSVGIDVDKL